MKPIKMILFYGGFAGDLITALNDMTCLVRLNDNGKVDLLKEKTLLQNNETQKKLSDAEKDKYLAQHRIISCCDTDFAFKNRDRTQVLYCDDERMAHFFCSRYFEYHPNLAETIKFQDYLDDFVAWNKTWPGKFKNRIDVANIFHDDFLGTLGIEKSKDKTELYENWRKINRKNFSIHTGKTDLTNDMHG